MIEGGKCCAKYTKQHKMERSFGLVLGERRKLWRWRFCCERGKGGGGPQLAYLLLPAGERPFERKCGQKIGKRRWRRIGWGGRGGGRWAGLKINWRQPKMSTRRRPPPPYIIASTWLTWYRPTGPNTQNSFPSTPSLFVELCFEVFYLRICLWFLSFLYK